MALGRSVCRPRSALFCIIIENCDCNVTKEMSEEQTLKLLDAFKNKKTRAEAGRSDDFLKSLSDRRLQKRLFIEFGLEEAK